MPEFIIWMLDLFHEFQLFRWNFSFGKAYRDCAGYFNVVFGAICKNVDVTGIVLT